MNCGKSTSCYFQAWPNIAAYSNPLFPFCGGVKGSWGATILGLCQEQSPPSSLLLLVTDLKPLIPIKQERNKLLVLSGTEFLRSLCYSSKAYLDCYCFYHIHDDIVWHTALNLLTIKPGHNSPSSLTTMVIGAVFFSSFISPHSHIALSAPKTLKHPDRSDASLFLSSQHLQRMLP